MTPQEFEQGLHDAEVKLARLRALYEQWFQGIERLEPLVARKDIDRFFEALRRSQPRNTALRFRFNQLVARYQTYTTYWQRISRQIEEGTFKRDKAKLDRKRAQAGTAARKDGAWELDELEELEAGDLADDAADWDDAPTGPGGAPEMDSPALPPAAPARVFGAPSIAPPRAPAAPSSSAATTGPRPAMPAAPAAPSSSAATTGPRHAMPAVPSAPSSSAATTGPRPAMPAAPAAPSSSAATTGPRPAMPAAPASRDDAGLRALYDRWIDARRRNNERVDVKFESLQQSVEKMMPKLRERHGDKRIDFDVVLQDGRVGLKPKVSE